MSQLPEAVRRSLRDTHFQWRTAEGVAKDADLALSDAVELLESSAEVRRAAEPNGHGKALYQLKAREPLVAKLLGAFANTPA